MYKRQGQDCIVGGLSAEIQDPDDKGFLCPSYKSMCCPKAKPYFLKGYHGFFGVDFLPSITHGSFG